MNLQVKIIKFGNIPCLQLRIWRKRLTANIPRSTEFRKSCSLSYPPLYLGPFMAKCIFNFVTLQRNLDRAIGREKGGDT